MKAMRDDLHVLTGSYALDAISDTEREEFERHLQHCPACEAEVRGLRETAARLALACAVTPPARMEQQVLAATYRTRQLPPLSADRPAAGPIRRRRASSRSAFPAAQSPAAWPSSPPRPAWPWPSRSGSPSCPPSTSSTRRGRPRSPGWSPRPTLTSTTARTSAGGSVTVVTSAALREAVVSASGMASLPSSRVYQVWVMSPSGARSAGLMHGSSLLASAVRPGRPDRHHRRARGRHGPPHHHPRRGPARLAWSVPTRIRSAASMTSHAISPCGIA